jgi:hypothetical protein
MKITTQTIAQIAADIGRLLQEHEKSLREAYLKLGDDLTVSMSIKFDTGKEQAKTSIKYPIDKVDDSVTTLLPDRQPTLFDNPKPIIPWAKDRCPKDGTEPEEEPCERCPLRSELIAVPGDRMPWIVSREDDGDPDMFYQRRSCSIHADDDLHDSIAAYLATCARVTGPEPARVYKLKKGAKAG